MAHRQDNIFLTGFSYTGKSVIGKEVASRLGWNFVDTDDEIVRLAGKEIHQIFSQDGEQQFRELERRVLREACSGERAVISTGGGMIADSDNRKLMTESGIIICLEARPETIYRRLTEDDKNSAVPIRPLLAADDPQSRIESLKASRQPYYALADWTVHTDELTIEEVCREVTRGWEYLASQKREDISINTPVRPGSPHHQAEGASSVITTATESYPVFVGWGSITELGERMRCAGLRGNANIISDETVFSIYGQVVKKSLEEAGFRVYSFTLPAGETAKTPESAGKIYDFLIAHRAERDDTIVALGGGVVGDLGGFAASTFLRGMPLAQVPTSLIAMTDASIGGKTAVNHPRGKNLIGTFYQPRLVLVDVQSLSTLPLRELTSGWAEVIKHGLILSPELFRFLEENADKLIDLDSEATTEAIMRSIAIKARVVEEDEKETGKRTILNYGHTIAHGLEAATDYKQFLHGEAVAIGMMGAAMLSQHIGLLSEEVLKRQQRLLERFGLPTRCAGLNMPDVLKAMELDKKTRDRSLGWVLLKDIGEVTIRQNVPHELVVSTINDLLVE